MKLLIATGLSLLVCVIIYIGMSIHYKTLEVRARTAFNAQQKGCESFYDEMWKTIAQKAQVPEAAKNAFKEIYTPLIEGRYGNEKGGSLMKWIQEQINLLL